jgi:hypothetical protein
MKENNYKGWFIKNNLCDKDGNFKKVIITEGNMASGMSLSAAFLAYIKLNGSINKKVRKECI